MPTPTCAHTKPNGSLCAARPLPGSPFCLFHDPARQDALAQSRSKGGSTPRRCLRRYPRLLDHMHVAELLSELFIDALNNPEAIDTQRLHALTALARTLLKAVGTPPTFLVHSDRREPHPAAGHLLRLYPPLTPEIESLLAAEPPADPDTHQPPPPASSPTGPIRTLEAGDGDAWNAAAVFLPANPDAAPPAAPPASPPPARSRLVDVNASLAELATVGFPLRPAPGAAAPGAKAQAPPSARSSPEALEQEINRLGTGPRPADDLYQSLLAALRRRPADARPTAVESRPAATPPAVAEPPIAPTPLASPAPAPLSLAPATPPSPGRPDAEQVLNRPAAGRLATNDTAGSPTCRAATSDAPLPEPSPDTRPSDATFPTPPDSSSRPSPPSPIRVLSGAPDGPRRLPHRAGKPPRPGQLPGDDRRAGTGMS